MEIIEHLEGSLQTAAALLKLLLELISAMCVGVGLFRTLRLGLRLSRRTRATPSPFVELRIAFGTWLALALEFQLGADILSTTISPTFDALAKLGITAIIRTFLNYFLNKELAEEAELQARLKQPIDSLHPHS